MASVLNQRDLSKEGLLVVLDFIFRNVHQGGVSFDIKDIIYRLIHPVRRLFAARSSNHKRPRTNPHPAMEPPMNGSCMIHTLPVELKRKLFGSFLPNKDVIIRPLCQKNAPKHDPKRKPRHNTVSDLMLLSKTFKEDVTACVYGERFFGIHVHEGVYDGGIEFLDTGRQLLHYKASIADTRFKRFDDGEFSFNKLKKIEITIHPSTEVGRHNAMTTYYINHALVRMLERSGQNDRIISLIIQFAQSASERTHASQTRRQIVRNEHPWWNHYLSQPRSTSIHGISDVELALRPFAMLTTVHNVRIYLPAKVKQHATSVRFSADLERSMQSNTALGTLGPNDELDRHAEIMRDEVESFIFQHKYGSKGNDIPNITEQEYFEDEVARVQLGEEDADGDLISTGWRTLHLSDDEADEEKLSAFTGPGHILSRMTPNMLHPKTSSCSWNIKRTVKRDIITKALDGTPNRRVVLEDCRIQTTSNLPPKRTFHTGVSSLAVKDLNITDHAENVGKALKRDPRDSPGRSREKGSGGTVVIGDKAKGPWILDMRSLARDREARSMKVARSGAIERSESI